MYYVHIYIYIYKSLYIQYRYMIIYITIYIIWYVPNDSMISSMLLEMKHWIQLLQKTCKTSSHRFQHWDILPETNIAPENRPGPKRKHSYSNHTFLGANSLLVSGRKTSQRLQMGCGFLWGQSPYLLFYFDMRPFNRTTAACANSEIGSKFLFFFLTFLGRHLFFFWFPR